MVDAGLSPKQEEIRRDLLALGQPRPTFDPALAEDLRRQLEEGLAAVASDLAPDDHLYVSKYDLVAVMACEGLAYARDREPFAWSLQNVRGTLGHRAIYRLVCSGYSIDPMDAVIEIVDGCIAQDEPPDLAAFLRGLGPGTRAELVGDVSDAVTKFAMDWPRVARRWYPRLESRQSVTLHEGRITLGGRVDLSLGRPDGTVARTFLCDLKSGREHHGNLYDVRFYALVETLVRRVPPFRVAVYYFDTATFRALDVDRGLLESEARRVIDAATRYHRARNKRLEDLERSPNPLCGHCPLLAECPPGLELTADRAGG